MIYFQNKVKLITLFQTVGEKFVILVIYFPQLRILLKLKTMCPQWFPFQDLFPCNIA